MNASGSGPGAVAVRSTAVASAVVQKVCEADFVEHAKQVSDHMQRGLEALAKEFPGSGVRGCGHLLALTLPKARATEIVTACLMAGLLINAPRPDVLRFMPSLATTNVEVDAMLGILGPILREVLA